MLYACSRAKPWRADPAFQQDVVEQHSRDGLAVPPAAFDKVDSCDDARRRLMMQWRPACC